MMPEVVWKRNDIVYIRIIFVTLSYNRIPWAMQVRVRARISAAATSFQLI